MRNRADTFRSSFALIMCSIYLVVTVSVRQYPPMSWYDVSLSILGRKSLEGSRVRKPFSSPLFPIAGIPLTADDLRWLQKGVVAPNSRSQLGRKPRRKVRNSYFAMPPAFACSQPPKELQRRVRGRAGFLRPSPLPRAVRAAWACMSKQTPQTLASARCPCASLNSPPAGAQLLVVPAVEKRFRQRWSDRGRLSGPDNQPRSRRRPLPVLVWDEGRKKRNQRAHAVNGNTASPSAARGSTAAVSCEPDADLQLAVPPRPASFRIVGKSAQKAPHPPKAVAYQRGPAFRAWEKAEARRAKRLADGRSVAPSSASVSLPSSAWHVRRRIQVVEAGASDPAPEIAVHEAAPVDRNRGGRPRKGWVRVAETQSCLQVCLVLMKPDMCLYATDQPRSCPTRTQPQEAHGSQVQAAFWLPEAAAP